MKLWESMRKGGAEERSFSLTEYLKLKSESFWLGGPPLTLGSKQEEIEQNFDAYCQRLFKANPVIFACVMRRMNLFSEARFKFREQNKGRPGELFGTPALEVFEKPWPNGSTSDLIKVMVLDGDIAGNFFGVRMAKGIGRLRPDWVKIVLGGEGYGDPKAVAVGYLYYPGGYGYGKPQYFDTSEVAHFTPTPDPQFPWRGMSWMTPVLQEVMADRAGTEHKQKYLEEGAVPSMVAKTPPEVGPEEFQKFKEIFQEEHSGLDGKFATFFLGGGADLTVVGSNMRQVDFKAVQAIGENRIIMASGVPSIIVGASEGLEAATLANFGSARRQFSDNTARSWWRDAANSLAPLVPVPPGSELWYDDRDIPYLQDDLKDRAEVQRMQGTAIEQLVKSGFTQESVILAINSDDLSLLDPIPGWVSVQLQQAGAPAEPPAEPSTNGKSPLTISQN